MNIDELEKLARAWADRPTVVNRTTFSNAANPAAILELIELVRTLLAERDEWMQIAKGESNE